MFTRSFLTFVAGIAVALAIPAMGQSIRSAAFVDIDANASFSAAVENMAHLGIIRGYENGRFGPDDSLTRAQVAVMFDRYDRTVVQPLRDQISAINKKLGLTNNLCSNGHEIGDTYTSADGCNICNCTLNGESCTKRACVHSSVSSRSSVAAPVCGNRICEAGEATRCPACPSGRYCAQYCISGSCDADCPVVTSQSSSALSKSRSSTQACRPYVCKDGTTHASCSSDGHVIYYFAPPCMTHGGDAAQ